MTMTGSGDTALTTPGGFLRAFRRRSLLTASLRLSLIAAVANESVRWMAVISNSFLGTELPVLSVGPFVLAVAFLVAVRKWSRTFTAAKADAALDFRDRLLSWVDFSSRRDLSPDVVRAQEEEVSSSLEGVTLRRLLPRKPLLATGPIFLLLSTVYPTFLLSSPSVPMLFRTAKVGTADSPTSLETLPPLPGEENGIAHGGGDPSASEGGAEAGEEGVVDAPPLADTPLSDGDPSKEVTTGKPEQGSERRRPTFQDPPVEDIRIASVTVGSEISPVVEPLYTPSGTSSDPPPELAGGTISFRLLPSGEAGKGGGGENSSAETPDVSVVIDLDGIPERYRTIVSAYFALLAAEADTGKSRQSGKERR